MRSDFVSAVKAAFDKASVDLPLFVYDSIGSTNDEARKYAAQCGEKGAFFIAREQTSGRGRRGRSFVSREGGLYISYLLYPSLPPRDAVMLTVFSAVALSSVVCEMTGVTPGIKWVNDLFLGGKKLAGILAEGEFKKDGSGFEYAVVGIGVNLLGESVAPELEGIATTLEAEIGVRVDVAEFAARLAKKLSAFLESDSESYMNDYRARSLVIGKRVKLVSSGESFSAFVLGIEDDGALRVKLDSGEERIFYSAEISVVLEDRICP